MNESIIVNFPAEISDEQKNELTTRINEVLEKIRNEVNSWNGFVDFVGTNENSPTLIAQCDNDEIRHNMQRLIDEGTYTH